MSQIIDMARGFVQKFDKKIWGGIVAEGSEQAMEAYISHHLGDWIEPLIYSDRWRKSIAFVLGNTSVNSRLFVASAIAAVIDGMPYLPSSLRSAVAATIRGLSSGGEDWIRDNVGEDEIEQKLDALWKKSAGEKQLKGVLKGEAWVTGKGLGHKLIHRAGVGCDSMERRGQGEFAEGKPSEIFDAYSHIRGFCSDCFPGRRAIDLALTPEKAETELPQEVQTFMKRLKPRFRGHFGGLFYYADFGKKRDLPVATVNVADLPDESLFVRVRRKPGLVGHVTDLFRDVAPLERFWPLEVAGGREYIERKMRERLGCLQYIWQLIVGGEATYQLVPKDGSTPKLSDADSVLSLRDGNSYHLMEAIEELVRDGDPDLVEQVINFLKPNVTYREVLDDPEKYVIPIVPVLLAATKPSVRAQAMDAADSAWSIEVIKEQFKRLIAGRSISGAFKTALAALGGGVFIAGALGLGLVLLWAALVVGAAGLAAVLYVVPALILLLKPLFHSGWVLGAWPPADYGGFWWWLFVNPSVWFTSAIVGMLCFLVIRFLFPPAGEAASWFDWTSGKSVALERRPGLIGWVAYSVGEPLRKIGMLPERKREVDVVVVEQVGDPVGRMRRIGITGLVALLALLIADIAVIATNTPWQQAASVFAFLLVILVAISPEMMQLMKLHIEQETFKGYLTRQSVRFLNMAMKVTAGALVATIVLSWTYDPVASMYGAFSEEVGLYYGKVRGWIGIGEAEVILLKDPDVLPDSKPSICRFYKPTDPVIPDVCM